VGLAGQNFLRTISSFWRRLALSSSSNFLSDVGLDGVAGGELALDGALYGRPDSAEENLMSSSTRAKSFFGLVGSDVGLVSGGGLG